MESSRGLGIVGLPWDPVIPRVRGAGCAEPRAEESPGSPGPCGGGWGCQAYGVTDGGFPGTRQKKAHDHYCPSSAGETEAQRGWVTYLGP